MSLTLKELLDNTRKFPSNREKKSEEIKIYGLEFLRKWSKEKRHHNLLIEALVSSSNRDSNYHTCLAVDGIRLMKERWDRYRIPVEGGQVFSRPFSASKDRILCSCDCRDYTFRFAALNEKHGALYGPEPEHYEQKTNRPPANSLNLPGICKHLVLLADILRDQGVLVD
jgi:hypothetical protein